MACPIIEAFQYKKGSPQFMHVENLKRISNLRYRWSEDESWKNLISSLHKFPFQSPESGEGTSLGARKFHLSFFRIGLPRLTLFSLPGEGVELLVKREGGRSLTLVRPYTRIVSKEE